MDKIYETYEEGRRLRQNDAQFQSHVSPATSVEDNLADASYDDRANDAKSLYSIG